MKRCFHNNSIQVFHLLSPTKNIRKDTFLNLNSLYRIQFNDVNLYAIEPEFAKYTPKLATFYANRNQIEIINNNVFNNLPLRWIRLDSNRIFHVADGAFRDMKLIQLTLNDNKLTNINATWFLNTTIVELELAYNQITSLHVDNFSGITGVARLNLQFNKIHYIAYDTFSNQLVLKNLDLSGNSLLYIGFKISNRLNFVDVGFNLISWISLQNKTALTGFSIYPNPWECKCLRQFLRKSEELNIKICNMPLQTDTPACVVVEGSTCNNSIISDTVHRKYFQAVNYNTIGKFVYRQENQTLNSECYAADEIYVKNRGIGSGLGPAK